MRVVFMGTPEFAVPTLTALIESKQQVIGVVTQPDKARGRGKAVTFSPVKQKAVENQIPVYQPVKARNPEFIETLKRLDPDVIVVVAFGQILPKEILDIPHYGCINVHASLLPKYRGAAPIAWAVLNGEEKSGVTTMHMAQGLDTGDMIFQKEVLLDPEETTGSLQIKLSQVGAELLLQTLNALEEGTAPRIPQDDAQAGQYAKMLKKEMGDIDFTVSAQQIERLVRGLNPWPSAYTCLNGKTLKIWKAHALDQEDPGVPGEILHVGKNSFFIKTGRGTLEVLELQLQGKKRMDTGAFLRGYPLKSGTVLTKAEEAGKEG